MINRDVTLYFEFRFGNSWTVPVAQTVAYHQVPMFAFDVIRDAPEWDFESVERN